MAVAAMEEEGSVEEVSVGVKVSVLGGLVAAIVVAIALVPAAGIAQPSGGSGGAAPAPTATAVSPYAIPVGKDLGYRAQSAQDFDAQWNFTGSLVFKVDPSGKITGGYLGDSDQDNPSYPSDPFLGREFPVTGTITPDNKITLDIGTGSLQWNISGTVTQTEITGNFSSTRFGLMRFWASRVHIPKHPSSIQRTNAGGLSGQ
jgi:hypothetical protein